jgi:hypothetical protein
VQGVKEQQIIIKRFENSNWRQGRRRRREKRKRRKRRMK